ncbi:elongation factor 1-beta-like [Hydractinia symbiolongicarpus]|uniref:elongation factor 1-beta-like n=1 Tax=Hydractinia symbiolongicarpus TaxID=13093 RepID=UPI00254A4140|nr:elongation factor 1-beta-like [Hydractinia symbiolongicarpus]
MGFGDLKTDAGLKSLNSFLADKSYIDGFTPSQADAVVFQALSSAPDSSHAHILRWYKHLQSYSTQDRDGFKGQKKAITEYGPRGNEQAGKADDDFDLFDDDDDDEEEEETEEQKKVKEERLAAYYAKKSKKPTVVAKSSLLLDVKPWDDETDVKKMEECVRSIKADGLLWGQAKYIPIAYGIKKLQINCVIEDDKISTDFLEEEITKFEDYVQSMDIAAFNKI